MANVVTANKPVTTTAADSGHTLFKSRITKLSSTEIGDARDNIVICLRIRTRVVQCTRSSVTHSTSSSTKVTRKFSRE